MNKKKLLIGGILILILVGGGFFIQKHFENKNFWTMHLCTEAKGDGHELGVFYNHCWIGDMRCKATFKINPFEENLSLEENKKWMLECKPYEPR